MEVQLQELVDRIKKDGVESGEAKAADIIKAAEAKAAGILANARTEAESIVTTAKAEASRSEKAAVSAIEQAGRNLLLAFRDGIGAQLDALIKAETAKTYDSGVLKELIPVVVKSWVSQGSSDDLSVIISSKEADVLEKALLAALKSEISKGVEIKTSSSLTGGFHIGAKDGSSYYDFSAEAVAELFSAYLNPKTAEILKAAAKEL